MFKRQETNLRRLLAMLLIPACLMCAGCEGAEGATRETKSDTSVSQSGETITDCKGYDYRFCFGEKAASSSVSRMNRLRLSLVVYVAFDYAFAVPSHGFAIVSSGP